MSVRAGKSHARLKKKGGNGGANGIYTLYMDLLGGWGRSLLCEAFDEW